MPSSEFIRLVTGGVEKEIAVIAGKENAAAAANLDIKNIRLAAVDGLFLKVTLETRGPVLPEGDPGLAGIAYRITFGGHKPDVVWTIRGGSFGGRGARGGGGGPRYSAFGPGLAGGVKVNGNMLSVQGTLPASFHTGDQITFRRKQTAPGDRMPPHAVKLTGLHSPDVDLSAVKPQDGPFAMAYESFHYLPSQCARLDVHGHQVAGR